MIDLMRSTQSGGADAVRRPRNDRPVIVTPPVQGPPMTTLEATLHSSGTSTVTVLLEQIITEIASTGAGRDPESRLACVGRVVRSSSWRSYRAGRVRLSGLTGVYWVWLAPNTARSAFVGDETTPLAWQNGERVFADVLVCDGSLDDVEIRERTRAALAHGIARHGDRFCGVRVLALAGVMRARFVSVDGASTALSSSEWWLGGEHDG